MFPPLRACLALTLLIFPGGLLPAATVVLTPAADTTLSEYFPDNNFGAMPFMNCGTSERGKRNRAVLRFDFTALPAGARIDGVTLKLEVLRNSVNDFAPAEVGLHRVLVPWGEGNKPNAPGGPSGQGSPATLGEATWNARAVSNAAPWSVPGATTPTDYLAAASAANTLYTPADYTFASTPALVADAQLWLDQPATNFGWIIVCANEADLYTARRIGTREDPVNTPQLTVDYTPFVFSGVSVAGNQFQFAVPVLAGRATTVEFNAALTATNWQTLTNFSAPPADTNYLITVPHAGPPRFFRLRSP